MSRRLRPVLAFALLTATAIACSQPTPPPTPPPVTTPPGPKLDTEEQKALYVVGVMMGRNLVPLKLKPAELAPLFAGLEDTATGKPSAVPLEQFGPRVQEILQKRASAGSGGEKEKGLAYAASAAAEQGARKLASGLVIKTLTPGKGPKPPGPGAKVKVHYRGTTIDGKEFDSSIARGEPAEFPLNQVIPCWTEGVQQMQVGEKARLVCPSQIAYGDAGSPPAIPGGATLIFEVELLGIR